MGSRKGSSKGKKDLPHAFNLNVKNVKGKCPLRKYCSCFVSQETDWTKKDLSFFKLKSGRKKKGGERKEIRVRGGKQSPLPPPTGDLTC